MMRVFRLLVPRGPRGPVLWLTVRPRICPYEEEGLSLLCGSSEMNMEGGGASVKAPIQKCFSLSLRVSYALMNHLLLKWLKVG